MAAKVIAIANQKGGTGKTTSTVNIGAGLAAKDKKVLIIDSDPQGDSTSALGWDPDLQEENLSTIYSWVMNDMKLSPEEGILHHPEGMDLLPANIDLCCIENSLINATCRESILKSYIQMMRKHYDYILIDCPPSLGMLSVNAFTACNEIIIPVQAAALPAKGLQQLIRSIGNVRRKLNPGIKFAGILITMVRETNNARTISQKIRENYEAHIRVFENHIPLLVKVEEQTASGRSIFAYAPGSSAAIAYEKVVEEVLKDEKKRS